MADFVVPSSIKDSSEDYFTLPCIKEKAKVLGLKTSENRNELFNSILSSSTITDVQKNEWVESVLHEGIKDVYMAFVEATSETEILFNNIPKYINNIKAHIENNASEYFIKNNFSNNLSLYKVSYFNDTNHIRLFYGCKLYFCYQRSNARPIIYPVIVDFYINKRLLIARAKPKSNLYEFTEGNFNFDTAKKAYSDKIIRNAFEKSLSHLSLSQKDKRIIDNVFKNKMYEIVNKYTKTPQEIVDLMNQKIDDINNIIASVCNICDLSSDSKVATDINNTIEKYFSIYYHDREIFIKDRDAYPIKLLSTDEEESMVEQTSQEDQPLQSKEIFFDNKRMLENNKMCQAVLFCWKSLKEKYYSKKFMVKLFSKNGFCIVKFNEYTSEEDINNVLFSIINS